MAMAKTKTILHTSVLVCLAVPHDSRALSSERVTRGLSLGSDVKSAPGVFCATDHEDGEDKNEEHGGARAVRVTARA